MTDTIDALPVLDLSRLDQGPEAADAFLGELLRATHEIGFFYLVGHGVPDELFDDVLDGARDLFALPDADKDSIAMTQSPHFRGFTRVGGERTQGEVDWREQIDLGPDRPSLPVQPGSPGWERLQGPNQWPAALPGLRDVVERWDAELSGVARRLLHAWARALGQPETVFDSAFGDLPATLMKIVRYPGRADTDQGVGAHKDSGVLTLLYVEPGKGGLQVEHPPTGSGQRAGQWIDAPAVPGAFVVNIGELLEFATGGYLRATKHRVVSPPEGTERISAPFFFNPALDSQIPILTLPAELAAEAPGVTADPLNPIFGSYGENAMKSRLRAHPDVAAIHHGDLVDRTA